MALPDDPHNPIPAASDRDGWSDHAPRQILPPRRERPTAPSARPEPTSGSLRIEARPDRLRADEAEVTRLQVEQIGTPVVRLQPEQPPVSRPEQKVTFEDLVFRETKKTRRRDEIHHWGSHRHHSARWLIAAGVGMVILLGIALSLLPALNDGQSGGTRPDLPGYVIDPRDDTPETLEVADLMSREGEGRALFARYARADSWEEVLPLVRNAPGVADALRTRHRLSNVPDTWEPGRDVEWEVSTDTKPPYAVLTGLFPDHTVYRAYMVRIQNTLQIDWKATECFSSASLDSLAKGVGDGSEIRVSISASDFFSTSFPESSYRSFKLEGLPDEPPVWCYVDRGSALDVAILRELNDGFLQEGVGGAARVTVSLKRGPEGSAPNQWVLDRLLASDWIQL